MKMDLCHCTANAHPSPFLIFSRTTTHTFSLLSRRTKSALSLTMSGMVMTPNRKTTETMPLKYNNTSSRRRSMGLELRNLRAVLSWADPTKPLPMNATINVPMTICMAGKTLEYAVQACSVALCHAGSLRLCTVHTKLAPFSRHCQSTQQLFLHTVSMLQLAVLVTLATRLVLTECVQDQKHMAVQVHTPKKSWNCEAVTATVAQMATRAQGNSLIHVRSSRAPPLRGSATRLSCKVALAAALHRCLRAELLTGLTVCCGVFLRCCTE